jgi:hypothetical protein
MVRENWRSFVFWRWWWRNAVPLDVKIPIVLVLFALLLFGGFLASGHLTGAKAAGSNASDTYIFETTIRKIVTVREHGKVVVKRVPVVIRRSVVRSSTAYQTLVDTQVVTTPGGVRYVEKKVLVPVVHKRVVRINGKTTTITETRLVPTTRIQTLTNVVTNQNTVTNQVTNQNTVVVNRTQTVLDPVTSVETRTVTVPGDNVTTTETVTQTETLPPETVTVVSTTTVVTTDPGGP